MIEVKVTKNQDAVFAPSAAQKVRLLSTTLHDASLPYRIRVSAANLLLPHLRLERDRLLQERIPAQSPARIREREPDYAGQVIGRS